MRLAFLSKQCECTVLKRGWRLNLFQIPSAVISPGKHYAACKANATARCRAPPFLIFLVLLTACVGSSSPPLVQRLPALPPIDKLPVYKVIGSGPIVVVLAMDMQRTLYDSATTETIVPKLLNA